MVPNFVIRLLVRVCVLRGEGESVATHAPSVNTFGVCVLRGEGESVATHAISNQLIHT